MEEKNQKREEEGSRIREFALEIEENVFFCDDNRITRRKNNKKLQTSKQMGLTSFTDIGKKLGIDTHCVIRTYYIAMKKIEKSFRELIAKGVL